MKLAIQICHYNEEGALPGVLKQLPWQIDSIESLFIEDGSVDNMSKTAKEFGADNVLFFNKNRSWRTAWIYEANNRSNEKQ